MTDNKRYFRCSDDLWASFLQKIKEDSLANNASEKLRDLIKKYIEEKEKGE